MQSTKDCLPFYHASLLLWLSSQVVRFKAPCNGTLGRDVIIYCHKLYVKMNNITSEPRWLRSKWTFSISSYLLAKLKGLWSHSDRAAKRWKKSLSLNHCIKNCQAMLGGGEASIVLNYLYFGAFSIVVSI